MEFDFNRPSLPGNQNHEPEAWCYIVQRWWPDDTETTALHSTPRSWLARLTFGTQLTGFWNFPLRRDCFLWCCTLQVWSAAGHENSATHSLLLTAPLGANLSFAWTRKHSMRRQVLKTYVHAATSCVCLHHPTWVVLAMASNPCDIEIECAVAHGSKSAPGRTYWHAIIL